MRTPWTVTLLTLLLLANIHTSHGLTRYVDADAPTCCSGGCTAPGTCSSLAAAVGYSSAGDTIVVADGVYNATSCSGLAISADLTITGNTADPTLVVCDGGNTPCSQLASVGAGATNPQVDLSGMHFHSYAGCGAAPVSVESGTLDVSDSVFSNCTNTGSGGVFSVSQSTLTLTDVSVSNCESTGGNGGAISADNNGHVTITSSTLTNLHTSGFGGAIMCGTNSTVDLTSTDIVGCTAASGGGVASGPSCTLTLASSSVSECSSSSDGGCLACLSPVTLTSTDLVGCSAGGSGGGLYATSDVSLTGGQVSGCSADNSGGGVHCGGTDCVLTSADVIGNNGGVGGGLALSSVASGLVDGCEISGNYAADGAGVAVYGDALTPPDPNVVIHASLITTNTATNTSGGVSVSNANRVVLTDSELSYNTGAVPALFCRANMNTFSSSYVNDVTAAYIAGVSVVCSNYVIGQVPSVQISPACATAGGDTALPNVTFCNVGGDGLDECALSLDDCDHVGASCTNTNGSFTCACEVGFTGDGLNCTDINECAIGSDNCAAVGSTCTNTVGSFTCKCNAGYGGNGRVCNDKDECALSTHTCAANETCTNSAGSFTCPCTVGYEWVGDRCVDINECTANTDNCANKATCTNTIGSFDCDCFSFFSGTGVVCVDVDECFDETDNCATDAVCTNTPGSFTCACPTGYVGDGLTCTETDECAELWPGCSDPYNISCTLATCNDISNCTNTAGSFMCTCWTGYQGNGVVCSDVNECGFGLDDCEWPDVCYNTVGSFGCQSVQIFSPPPYSPTSGNNQNQSPSSSTTAAATVSLYDRVLSVMVPVVVVLAVCVCCAVCFIVYREKGDEIREALKGDEEAVVKSKPQTHTQPRAQPTSDEIVDVSIYTTTFSAGDDNAVQLENIEPELDGGMGNAMVLDDGAADVALDPVGPYEDSVATVAVVGSTVGSDDLALVDPVVGVEPEPELSMPIDEQPMVLAPAGDSGLTLDGDASLASLGSSGASGAVKKVKKKRLRKNKSKAPAAADPGGMAFGFSLDDAPSGVSGIDLQPDMATSTPEFSMTEQPSVVELESSMSLATISAPTTTTTKRKKVTKKRRKKQPAAAAAAPVDSLADNGGLGAV